MTRLDTLLLVMAVVVLAMGVVVSVMMWQSRRRRESRLKQKPRTFLKEAIIGLCPKSTIASA